MGELCEGNYIYYTLYLLLRGEYKICPGAMFALPTIFWMLPFACALDGNTPGNFKDFASCGCCFDYKLTNMAVFLPG